MIISAQSPKVLRVSQIKEDSWVRETLQRNGDHFYATVGKRTNETRDLTEDLVIDSFIFVSTINPSSGFPIGKNCPVILDYKIGEGFVDYDYISNTINHEGYYKDDSLVAFGYVSNHCTWNGRTYSPEIIPDTSEAGRYIGVINYKEDTLLFLTKTSVASRLEVDMLTLNGDYLYLVTRTNADTFEFMGDFFPEIIDPNWNVKYIHKINWKTGVKEWSHQFSTDIDQDYLFDIKVVDDGNLIIAKRITGRAKWDGEPIDSNSIYNSGYAFFKINPDGELIDYIQSACNCKGFHKVHIEEDGALMLYGAQKNMPNLTLGDASLELYSDTLFGLFGFVPSDWNNPWIKSYHGSYQNAVTGGALLSDNIIIGMIGFKEEIQVEGLDFITQDAGIYPHPEDGKGESVLVGYNIDGTVAKNPISLPLDARMYEIYEVNKNHYLFYIREDYGDTSYLFDTKLDSYGSANFMLFEIEGNLFDIANSLDELIRPYLYPLDMYPNPIASSSVLTISMNQDFLNFDKLLLISSMGDKIPLIDYTIKNEKVVTNLPTLFPGVYYLQVQSKGHINTAKLIIK